MKRKSFIGKERGAPFVARDEALIYELFRESGLAIRNMSIASGTLKRGQRAISHFHRNSEEMYYVLSGHGRVYIGDTIDIISAGDAVFIPIGAVHALDNRDSSGPLKVLAISSPPYSDEDIFFVE